MGTEEALKSCCDRARQERDYTAYLQAESELADLYLKAGRFEEAFLAAEDVLMLMEELNLEETESFGAALVQAAVACRESGRSREALKGGYVIDDCEGPHKVWTREGNVFTAHPVSIGLTDGLRTEITGGLEEGTEVITEVKVSGGKAPKAGAQFMPGPPRK